jgi:hypothetical protein
MMSFLLKTRPTLLLKKRNKLYCTRSIHHVTVKLIRVTHEPGVALQDRDGKLPYTCRVNISIPLSKEVVKKHEKI